MTDEELKHEAIQYAVDYPTSYGKGYKHKDLRIAYLAGAEFGYNKAKEEDKALIEKMKSCSNCIHYSSTFGLCHYSMGDEDYDCRGRKWEIKEK